MSEALLRVDSISKSYGDLRVLENVSATIHAGEIVAVRGASGTGKSTLLNIIGLLDKPDSGSVSMGDTCITDLKHVDDHSQVRGQDMGFIFQAYHLLPEFSVLENILMPIKCIRRSPSAFNERALQLLEQVGLLGREHDLPRVLSGGERQRVAVCRSLIHQPKLLLADEPTGNLDPDTTTVVLEQLFKLAREQGSSILMVSHDPTVCVQADRQLVIENHQLNELTDSSTL